MIIAYVLLSDRFALLSIWLMYEDIADMTKESTYDCVRGHFFVFLKLPFVCFVVAIFDLVHDLEAIHVHGLWYL